MKKRNKDLGYGIAIGLAIASIILGLLGLVVYYFLG